MRSQGQRPKEQLRSVVEAVLGRAKKPTDSDEDSLEGTVGPEGGLPLVGTLRGDETILHPFPYEIICLSPIHGARPFVITVTAEDGAEPN